MKTFAELYKPAVPTKKAEALRLEEELSRYCVGRHENGASVTISVKPTKTEGVFVAADAATDAACIVIEVRQYATEYTVYHGAPAIVSGLINKNSSIGEIEEAVGSEGRWVYDGAKTAVSLWQLWRSLR